MSVLVSSRSESKDPPMATRSTVTTPTFADLLEQLGDISADRVLLRPYPGTATEQDVIEIDAREDRLCELVDGVLVEKAPDSASRS